MFGAACLSKPAFGGSRRSRRRTDFVLRNLQACAAGDWAALLAVTLERGNRRAARPAPSAPPAASPPLDPDGTLSARTKRRATRFADAGQYRKCADCLDPQMPAEQSDTNVATARGLVERPVVRAATPAPPVDPLSALHLAEEVVSDTCSRLRTGVAPGLDLLTQQHLAALTDRGKNAYVVQAITVFANAVFNGSLTARLCDSWVLDSAFATFVKMEADGSTPKTNSAGNPDLRPIGMGGSLWGLVLRAAIRSCKAELQAILVEAGQFGFGVSSGVEAVAVSVASWLADADDQALQSVVGTWDGKNAYPSVSRAAMLDAVRDACPQLLPLFRLAYGGPRRMVWGRRSPGKHRIDIFVCEEGTVQGCVLASLGYCLAVLPAMLRVRAAFPDVHLAAIIDDTNFLARVPGRASAAMLAWASEMAAIGVATVVHKTLVTASDNCDLSAGVPGATTARGGINFVGTPVAPESVADSFAAGFIRKRLAGSIRQLGRLHLLGDPQLAVRLLQTTFAGRARYLASIVPGDWAGGRPGAGAALREYAAAVRAAADACHPRPLPADVWCSQSEGGMGLQLIDCVAEHAYAFLCCQLRVLRTLRAAQPALAAALLASAAPHSFSGRVAAARAALPPKALSSTPAVPALFNLDNQVARAHAESRKRAMVAWRRELLRATLAADPARLLAYTLRASKGAVGCLFLSGRSCAFRLTERRWNAVVCNLFALPAPGLEGLACADNPAACAALVRSSVERIATHDGVRDALDVRAKAGGLASEKEVTGLLTNVVAVPAQVDNPPPGVRRLGDWRRLDLVLGFSSGVRFLLDVTTPCALTGPRVRAFAAGGAADAHVVAAALAKLRKYPDAKAGCKVVPLVVGMWGEVGADFVSCLAAMAVAAAESAGVDRKSGQWPQFVERHTRETKMAVSIALTLGKAAQLELAQDAVARAAAAAGRRGPAHAYGQG